MKTLIVIVCLSFFVPSAFGNPVQLSEEKFSEQESTQKAGSKVIQAEQIPTFLDIARDANGKVMHMNHSDAVQYCANRGARLPSARELAQLSMSFGADGIVDTCGSDQTYCYKVSNIQNADGSKDEFYFRSSGYQRPAGDLGKNWFWSSSISSKYSGDAFSFDGRLGDIDINARNEVINAALCVVGP